MEEARPPESLIADLQQFRVHYDQSIKKNLTINIETIFYNCSAIVIAAHINGIYILENMNAYERSLVPYATHNLSL